MKLIVCYESYGSSNFQEEILLCFEYESIEKFLEDFEEELLDAVCHYDRINNLYTEWELKQPEVNAGMLAYNQWLREKPKEKKRNANFTFCGMEFCFFDFYQKKELLLPEVQELNNWFSKRCINKND